MTSLFFLPTAGLWKFLFSIILFRTKRRTAGWWKHIFSSQEETDKSWWFMIGLAYNPLVIKLLKLTVLHCVHAPRCVALLHHIPEHKICDGDFSLLSGLFCRLVVLSPDPTLWRQHFCASTEFWLSCLALPTRLYRPYLAHRPIYWSPAKDFKGFAFRGIPLWGVLYS